MAGKGLHKAPLATQSCYYYLVPKLLHACSPPGAEPSTEPSCLSVCLSGTRYSKPSWTEVENTSEIILPHPLLCGLKFRAREEKVLSRGRAFQAEGTASAKAQMWDHTWVPSGLQGGGGNGESGKSHGQWDCRIQASSGPSRQAMSSDLRVHGSLCLCRTWWGRRHQESSQEAITIPRPGAGENGHSEHVSKVETDLWKAWGHQRRKGSRGPLFFLTKWQDQVAISQAGESCKKSRFEGDQEFGLTCGL